MIAAVLVVDPLRPLSKMRLASKTLRWAPMGSVSFRKSTPVPVLPSITFRRTQCMPRSEWVRASRVREICKPGLKRAEVQRFAWPADIEPQTGKP